MQKPEMGKVMGVPDYAMSQELVDLIKESASLGCFGCFDNGESLMAEVGPITR